ncbi:hypothetical protein HMPREF0293_2168 [Corynebacterium glucuronolyticum ATCC 51866]|uniref:Uncharacterized protein n=1 Tax=Corynebacterium glucuronolyticum ATCC 51866 TaxID=548478 RepID=A0ABM9XML5_9CORY|nr:hypothetical protein HMPREF0293_2168 [Corynebacterium glucuronolyticum ATCC 51866]
MPHPGQLGQPDPRHKRLIRHSEGDNPLRDEPAFSIAFLIDRSIRITPVDSPGLVPAVVLDGDRSLRVKEVNPADKAPHTSTISTCCLGGRNPFSHSVTLTSLSCGLSARPLISFSAWRAFSAPLLCPGSRMQRSISACVARSSRTTSSPTRIASPALCQRALSTTVMAGEVILTSCPKIVATTTSSGGSLRRTSPSRLPYPMISTGQFPLNRTGSFSKQPAERSTRVRPSIPQARLLNQNRVRNG